MRPKFQYLVLALTMSLLLSACSSNSDSSQTTMTTYVSPPPHQALKVVPVNVKPAVPEPILDPAADPTKPLLIFPLVDGTKVRVGETVLINFSVRNAKLKSNGGEFRVRYIVDDEEMQWIDSDEPFGLQGWVAGEHTIRMELVGPDGWPFRNGNANIVTRKINVTPQ